MFKNIVYSIKKKLYRSMEENDITMEELIKMQKSGAKLIDVRSKQEYNEGHLDGAINIPEYELKSYFNNSSIDKSKMMVVYCISGYRSKRACIKLNKMGYSNVYNLRGGLEEY